MKRLKDNVILKQKWVKEAAVLFILMLIGFFMLYKNETSLSAKEDYFPVVNQTAHSNTKRLVAGDMVEQKIDLRYMDVSSIRVQMYNNSHAKDLTVKAELLEDKSGKMIDDWEINAEKLPKYKEGDLNNIKEFTKFELKDTMRVDEEKEYLLRITVSGDKKESIEIEILTDKTLNNTGKCTINGKGSYGIVMAVEMEQVISSNSILVIYVIVFLGLLIALVWFLNKKVQLEKVFILIAACLGVFYICILAPYSTPDEYKHIETAFYHSSRILGTEAVDEDGNVMLRACDYVLQEDNDNVSRYALDLEWKHLFERDKTGKMVSGVHEPMGTPVIGYLPQIAGMVIARILGLGQVPMLLLARILALALHIALVFFAIRKMPFGKMLIFTIGLFPMVLQQACSFSYDGTVNALSLFLVAYCFGLAYGEGQVKTRDMVILGIAVAWLAPCKAVYSLLCLMVLIIPKEKFKNKKMCYICKGILMAVIVGSMLLFNISTLLRLLNPQRTELLAAREETAFTTSDILAEPTRVMYMVWNTVTRLADNFFFEMIGSRLGWLEVNISQMTILGYALIAFLGVMKSETNEKQIRFRDGLFLLVICAGVAGGVFLAMLLDWTDKRSSYIVGLQGRYFLPILPILAVLIRNKFVIVRKGIEKYLVYGLFLIQFCTVFQIIAFVTGR